MPRKRSGISQTRSLLYGLARFLGDVQAISKGSRAVAKRVARRAAGRTTARALRKLFK
ncbi:hypothetical protein KVG29_01615 [Caldicoprobacter algeriensis]|uniref:hypothetical protein n=1 Tax=Caldicoprobacter algeriensis TaxID=699281 RepID=UPI00207B0704|nr:hypothetical protein [Caldicoprobacter algeriensis]MCM8899919.1 hypothetical protein [Caldicoprobacter algeriensis]